MSCSGNCISKLETAPGAAEAREKKGCCKWAKTCCTAVFVLVFLFVSVFLQLRPKKRKAAANGQRGCKFVMPYLYT